MFFLSPHCSVRPWGPSNWYQEFFPLWFRDREKTPTSIAQANNTQIYTSTPPYVLMAWCFLNVPREKRGRQRGVVRVSVGSRIFTSPYRPDRLWDPPNLLTNEHWGLFPEGKAAGAWSWLLNALVPRTRKRGSIHPFPHASSWRIP
jgi:hypothetical protein